jgi:hypothetical protein
MMKSKESWVCYAISWAQLVGPRQYRHWEDGFLYNEWPEGWTVVIYNKYGQEYWYNFKKDLTEDQANELVARCQTKFLSGGQPDFQYWTFARVQYGSQAYLDEEPYIVEREKADDLAGFNYF